jgi:hypothetical protein
VRLPMLRIIWNSLPDNLPSFKVIEPSVQAGDLCTRREYARWLVVASNCLSRCISFLLHQLASRAGRYAVWLHFSFLLFNQMP